MSKGKLIGKSIQEMIDEIRKTRGAYEAKRLERAADEVPNLERLYQREALEGLFSGDNAEGIMTMRPEDFEKYAIPIVIKSSVGPKAADLARSGDISKYTVPTDEYIKHLQGIKGGFKYVPNLEVQKEKSGLPLFPYISGHEGRHRMRALAGKGQPSAIVQFSPRAGLRESFPRSSREEYIRALNEEMSRYANMVRPEQAGPQGPLVKLPDVYKQGGPVHMSKGGRLAKSLQEMAAELATKTKKPEVSRIDMGYKDVTKRIPELTEAARLVKSGQMSPKQYSDIVNRVKPVTPYDFVPKPASAEEAVAALTSNKKGQFGKSSEIKEGERADLRLDIPSYSQHGVWVNSIHRKDAPTVYSSVSSVKNAEMIPSADKALKVATGETPKSPFAVIRGEWNPMDEESAVKAAQKYLQDKNWRQVGYDPERHGYFYDRETMAPVLGAEEVIQIGPLVLAKKPKYGSQEDFPFKDGGPVHKQDGGSIKASPAKPGQQFLGRLGQVAEKLGIKLEEAMKIVAQEGNSPVKAFLVNMLGSETLKSAGTALQDWTGTPRDATEDYPYRRLVTGKGMTAQFDPRLVDVAPIAGTAASRVAGAMKNLPTDVMRAATAAYGPRATASPMDVWHGSPHRFPPTAKNPLGEFDPTKIGTGEGNQAYGYGHYLAEARGTGETYAKNLANRDMANQGRLNAHANAQRLASLAGDPKYAADDIRFVLTNEPDHPQKKLLQETLTFLESGDFAKPLKEKGSLYKVDLPDEQIAKMLDWEKHLDEQSPQVQKILSDYQKQLGTSFGRGERVLKEIAFDRRMKGLDDSPAAVANQLKELGIPGIKYFDASSRDVGEGTRNFVVFPGNEEMLTIKERMKDGGPAHKAAGGIARRLAKYGKHHEPAKKTEIFIGEKSPLWNQDAAGAAVKMEKAGVSPVDIWKQTGTFRSPDGALRQEISDVGSKFRGEKEMKELAASMKQQEADIKAAIAESKLHPDLFPKQLTAAQKQARQQAKDIKARRTMEGGPEYRVGLGNRAEFALEHPELYEAYPLLSGMDVQQGGSSGSALGSYIRGINESDPGMVNIYDRGLSNDPRSTMIHEAQHAIQDIEGWGRGGNPTTAFQNQEAFDILNQMRKQALEPMTYEEFLDKYKGSGIESMSPSDAIKHYELYKKRIPEKVKQIDNELQRQAAKLYYDRLAGEAEARAAQARIDLTPRQRLENFPLETGTQYGYDVKPEDIIVKREKKGGQVSIDAMRLAVGGMASGGIRKRGIAEVTKLFEAAQKTRSRAAQEAAGLYHPIGGGVKLSQPVELMTSKTFADPSVKPVKRRIITPEEMQGGIALPLIGDRAAAGRILTEVGGQRLSKPVNLQGGPGFMQTHTLPDDESAAWASGQGVISRLSGLAQKAAELGGTDKIYAPYVAMSPTGVDFNAMVAQTVLNQYDPSALTKKAKKEFLNDVRNYVPDKKKPHIKPGSVLTEADLNDVEALREKMLSPDAGPLRKVFVQRMGTNKFQNQGFPNVAAARAATTEPELMDIDVGSTGHNIALINPEGKIIESPKIPHETYPVQLSGEYFGSLEQPVSYKEFFPGYVEARRALGKPEKDDWYTFGRSMPLQQLDQEWVDRMMKSSKNPREWKKGGAVKKAEGGQITADDLIVEERPL